ncbi:hypothetical protein [Lysobacter claricitrinus]|uniref:hypothetical protein n=1 Tax=Lysobacter claricitrinus TaxID=3367728 RepID=UPI0037DB75E6
MLSKRIRTVAAATLMILAGAAQAEVLTFHFTGTVTETLDPAVTPVGSHVEGSFSYDDDTAPGISLPGYAAYQPDSFVAGTVSGHSVVSDRLNVEVYDNYGGNVEDVAVVSGGPIMVDDALYVDGSFGLSFASAAGNTGVLHGTGLPTIYDLADFNSNVNAQQVAYGWVQKDGSQTGLIAHFRVDSITGGHEPCTNPHGKPKKCKKVKAGR